MKAAELASYRLDHLGMVATMADEIGLVDIIDSLAGVDKNEIVTTGQATLAMVVNCLGFVSRPLYITPQFFQSKLVHFLIGKCKTAKKIELKPEHLNESKLGRTLDKIYEMGPDTLFQTIAFAAARKQGLKINSLHGDTTTHSFYGDYVGNNADGMKNSWGGDEPCEIQIAHAFSKDHRADCKQIVQELLVSSDGDVPLMLKVHSGNASDVIVFRERIAELKKQFIAASAEDLMPEYIVFDCKFYAQENLKLCKAENQKWITRVPDNITEVRECIANAVADKKWTTIGKNEDLDENESESKNWYRYRSYRVTKNEVRQQFIVVKSKTGMVRAQKTIERRIETEREKLLSGIKKISEKPFACEPDARVAAQEILKKCVYFKIKETKITSIKSYLSKRRPKANENPVTQYFVDVEISEPTPKEVATLVEEEACFVIGTNEQEESKAAEIISLYRKEQQGVERAFRFLKNPMYFAEASFLKNRKRVVALVTIMTIALLIYSLLQRKIRILLEQKGETLPNQKKKPTKRPTMNWVNLNFEGVDVIRIGEKGCYEYKYLRMNDFVQKTLMVLGPDYQKRYSAEFFT